MRIYAQAFIGVCLTAAAGLAQVTTVAPSADTPAIPSAKAPPTVSPMPTTPTADPAGDRAVLVRMVPDMMAGPVAGAEVPGVDLSPLQQARVNTLIMARDQALYDFDRAAGTNVALLQVDLAAAANPRMGAQIQQKLDRIASQRQLLADRTDLLVVTQVLTPQQRLERNRALLARQAMLQLEPVDLTAGQAHKLDRMLTLAAVQRGSFFDINADGRVMNPQTALIILSVLNPQQRLEFQILSRNVGTSSGSDTSRAAAASAGGVPADQARGSVQASKETRSTLQGRTEGGSALSGAPDARDTRDAGVSDGGSAGVGRRPAPTPRGQQHR